MLQYTLPKYTNTSSQRIKIEISIKVALLKLKNAYKKILKLINNKIKSLYKIKDQIGVSVQLKQKYNWVEININ